MKKLTGNGLWESSRMVLPEHIETFNQYRKKSLEKTKPDLDEQKLDEISAIIRDSYRNHISLNITIWGEYEKQQFVGIVTHLDPNFKHLTLMRDREDVNINCTFIIDVSYEDR